MSLSIRSSKETRASGKVIKVSDIGGDEVRQATSIYSVRIIEIRGLDETTTFGSLLNLVFGSSNRRGDALVFGLDKGSIIVDTLSVTFEIVKTRETTSTVGVWARVGFGSKRVVRLNVGLRKSQQRIHVSG